MTAAAFRATYADWRLVKSRGVVQVVFEVPLHASDEAYGVVGGMPDPAKERWFAIARLSPTAKEVMPPEQSQHSPNETHPRPAEQPTKPAGAPKSYAQRVALLCQDRRFQKFLQDRTGLELTCEARAAEYVRELCQVQSRAEIVEGSRPGMKWRALAADYDNWARGVVA